MIKCFKIVDKSHFGSSFVILPKAGFSLKNSSVTHNFTGTPNPMPNITKTNATISRKLELLERQDGLKDGQKDRQTLIYRSISLMLELSY